jgi:hypothetical protein
MSENLHRPETVNPATLMQMEEYIDQIFEAAIIYYNFEENFKKINESKENNNEEKIYMISKGFLDNFINKINYDKTKALFAKPEDEENKQKIKDILMSYPFDELELIIYGDINVYGDFEKIEEDCKKGFGFVNYEFLEKLDCFNVEMKENNIDYYKNNDNIIIVFSDKSKLIISEKNGEKKYCAIPSPVNELKSAKNYKKIKTYTMNNRVKTRK